MLQEVELCESSEERTASKDKARKRSRSWTSEEDDLMLLSSQNLKQQQHMHIQKSTYWSLLQNNRSFRLFFASYTASHLGEWLTYLASIAAIERIYNPHNSSDIEDGDISNQHHQVHNTMIGILIIVRLLPNVWLAPLGGVLADGRDRRQSMVALDVAGAVVGLLFLWALQQDSVVLLYVATFVQQCVAGLYEPCRSAIVPLLVDNEQQLKTATTINGLTWSVVAAVGSSLGGFLVSWLGLQACVVIDAMTYLLSALLMYLIPGDFVVVDDDDENEKSMTTCTEAKKGSTLLSLWYQVKSMLTEGMMYVWNSFFGALVLLKASAAVVYGACDVLNVAFSERGDNGEDNAEDVSSRLLGILFGSVGVGCLVGPLVFDSFTDMEHPKSLQLACVVSMALVSGGAILMGICHSYFWMTCLFTAVRSAGSSVLWINSSLLLQKFASASVLGRVTSIDYSLALLSEAISAFATGELLDKTTLLPEQVSVLLGLVGSVLTVLWLCYHTAGHGAGSYAPLVNDGCHDGSDSPSTDRSVTSETSQLLDGEDV